MNAIVETATRPAGAEQETRRADRARVTAYVRDKATETVLREACRASTKRS